LADLLERTLDRHLTTTRAIDELLTRTDHLLTAAAAAVLGRQLRSRTGAG